MMDNGATLLRLGVFVVFFLVLAACEFVRPLRPWQGRVQRWPTNIGLSVVNSLVLRVSMALVPGLGLAVAATVFAGFGLLPSLGVPGALQQVIGFVLLDAAVYAQHRVFHLVPVLWRLHQVHHADLTLDVSSAVRFHPIEILLSQAWKLLVVIGAGVPPGAALAFEIVLNAGSMFSHANVRLPTGFERIVRRFVVTPDMHRIHHSVQREEMNSNFGFNFSVWDRMFGSYVGQPKQPADTMDMGLPDYRGSATSAFAWLLAMPFRRGSPT